MSDDLSLGRRLVAGPRILDPGREVRILPPQVRVQGAGYREQGTAGTRRHFDLGIWCV